MTDLRATANMPVFFERNRVRRVYDGGMLFGDFLGDEKKDGKFPEEWIASSVKALNRDNSDPREGLSVIEGTDITFKELLEKEKRACLGDREQLGILVKYLDSAVRLPIQAHPDKEFSRRHFKSEFGKTEVWLVLGVRPGAKIYFGFNRRVTQKEFSAAVEKSGTDKDIMTGFLREVPVKTGDVFFIPPKCVHAIGYGCLILEIQEPTDFTLQPEYWCGDYPLNEYEMYLGLSKEAALSCFDFNICGKKSESLTKKNPMPLSKNDGYISESLVSYADTPCFAVNRHTVTGEFPLNNAPSVWVVADGEGEITGQNYSRAVKKGGYFFLPYSAKGFSVRANGAVTLVECLPPE